MEPLRWGSLGVPPPPAHPALCSSTSSHQHVEPLENSGDSAGGAECRGGDNPDEGRGGRWPARERADQTVSAGAGCCPLETARGTDTAGPRGCPAAPGRLRAPWRRSRPPLARAPAGLPRPHCSSPGSGPRTKLCPRSGPLSSPTKLFLILPGSLPSLSTRLWQIFRSILGFPRSPTARECSAPPSIAHPQLPRISG